MQTHPRITPLEPAVHVTSSRKTTNGPMREESFPAAPRRFPLVQVGPPFQPVESQTPDARTTLAESPPRVRVHVSIHNATSQGNLWKGAPIDWINVLLNVGTYALLVSDVPRAGVLTKLNMRQLSRGVYSWFGSFAYQAITFYRDPDNVANTTAVHYDNVVDHAHLWSFNYDTTSIGIRTITSHFNDTVKYILNCMNYRIHCNALSSFTPHETFEMLDRVIAFPSSIPDENLPAMINAAPIDPYRHLRLSKLVKNRHAWILNDYLAKWPFDPITRRVIRASSWKNANGSFDLWRPPEGAALYL